MTLVNSSTAVLPNLELNSIPRTSNVFAKVWNRTKLAYVLNIKERIIERKAHKAFLQVFGGHIFFQVLSAATEIGLFELLDREPGLNCSEIAARLNITEQPCEIMLLPLVTCNFLKKHGTKYSNSNLTKLYLTSHSKHSFVARLKWQAHINYRAMPHFLESVRSSMNLGLSEFPGDEPTLYQRLARNPELEGIFQGAMTELSAEANSHLCDYVDFTCSKKVIDVGGGAGTNLIALANKNPHLDGSVFDFPTVCERAKVNFSRNSLGHRLDAISGNIFNDPLPTDADCILFCHFFTIWSKQTNLVMLRKAYEALPHGGRAMIFNIMQNDDRTGPQIAAIGSPYFLTLATGQGMLYSWSDYRELFAEAGFSRIASLKLPCEHGVIWGFKE